MYEQKAASQISPYPQPPQDYDAAKPATLSDKAAQVLRKIAQAEEIADAIAARLIPPTPAAAAEIQSAPKSSHIVFVLDKADQRLDYLCERLALIDRVL